MPNLIPEIYGLGIYDASITHKNRNITPKRLVSLYEIEYILEDGGTSHINGKSYPIKKGSIIIAKPGYSRRTELPFKTLYVHLMVDDPNICELLDKCPDYLTTDNPEIYENALRSLILESASDSPFRDIKVWERLFAVFSLLIQNAETYTFKSENTKSNLDVVRSSIKYMDDHFCEAVTLDDVAKYVHLSRIYFRSVFVAATGLTPYKYIRNKRLAKAKQLLLTTDKTFACIASECGFSSQSYMNSVFREEFDKTPKQFREETSLMY